MNTSSWTYRLQAFDRVAGHAGEIHSPAQWTWEPSVIIGIALMVSIYLYLVSPFHRRRSHDSPVGAWRISSFLLGSGVLFLSLVSPLDVLSDEYLFSAHMVQHILLAMIAPLLLLLGTPGWLLQPLVKPQVVLRVARVLTDPVPAFLIFNFNFWLWHLPTLYDQAVGDERIHIFQHLTFIATGVLNWWPIFSPLRELPRFSHLRQLLYMAANCQPNVILGAILFFSRGTLYQAYVDAPRVFDISTHADQQIGGLIMWIPGNAIYMLVFSIVFLQWLQREEPAQRQSSA